MRRTIIAATVVAAGLSLAACDGTSEGDEQQSAATSAAAETSTEPTAEPTAEENAEAAWHNFVQFVNHVSAYKYDEATSLVAPGSTAERYLTHQKSVDAADVANGHGTAATRAEDVPSLAVDDEARTITWTHVESGLTYTWKDLVADADGKIMSWTGATGPVDTVLWHAPASGSGAGQNVNLVSAYRTNGGSMVIVLEVSFAAPGDVDWHPSYVAADGIAREASAISTPSNTIQAGQKALAAYVFEGADFGGQLIYTATDTDYNDVDIPLTIQ